MFTHGKDFMPFSNEANVSFESTFSDDSSWVLSLSDLMSLLLIFFLVWTTIKITHLEKRLHDSGPRPNVSRMHIHNMERLKGMLFEFSPAETSSGRVMVVLNEEVTFASGSSAISEDGKKMIFRIAKVLKGSTHYKIKIVGHSNRQALSKKDHLGSNVDISISRAAAVARELIRDGMDPERVWIQGVGDLYPQRENSAQNSKRFNRRVELLIEPAD